MIFDDRICELGEGPIWHPERAELFWFDIVGKRLYSKENAWSFDRYTSAAGWVSGTEFLLADAASLFRFNIETGARDHVVDLEPDDPVTRSNDGRADPFGGFWIGTMGFNAEAGAGGIYRYYKGELRKLYPDITIPNAICFAPDGSVAYFADTLQSKVWRVALDGKTGWPKSDPELWLDFTGTDINPDGAVVAADGSFWNAQWGSNRVAGYAPDGSFLKAYEFPANQTSCPAFGGPDMTTLYCTSATEGMSAPGPSEGKTYVQETDVIGQPENQVIL